MQQRRGGWVSLAIFLVFVFGSRIFPPLAAWLSQVTGLPISAPALIIGTIVIAVAFSMLSSAVRGLGRAGGGGVAPPMQPPTQMSQAPRPMAPPRSTTGLGSPPPAGAPARPTQLPSAPRFEPVIDPRIVVAGVVGLVVLGGIFLAVLAMAGGISAP